MSKRWLPGLVLLLIALLPRTAGAQEADAAPDLPPPHAPRPARVAPAAPPAPEPHPGPALEPEQEGARVASRAERDPEALFRAFDTFVKQERAIRITGALGGIVVGGVLAGVGGWAADRTGTTQTPWFIAGGAVAGLATLALVIPGRAESIASSMRARGHTEKDARALEAEWRELAETARTERYVGAVLGLVLGAGAVGTGIGIMNGAGDLTGDEKTAVGGILVGTGAGLLFTGGAALFQKTRAESSFEQYSATRPAAPPLDVSVTAGPGGFLLGAGGAF